MIKKQKRNKKIPLFSLTNRTVLYLLGLSFVIFFLYIGGNWQNFLDVNQTLLLRILGTVVIFLASFLLLGFVLIIIQFIKKRSLYYVKYLALYFLYSIITLIFFIFSSAIQFFSLNM